MSLRAKLALVLASLAAMAAVGVGYFSYHATSSNMLSEIDRTLTSARGFDRSGFGLGPTPGPASPFTVFGDSARRGADQAVYQLVAANGQRIVGTSDVMLPADKTDVAIAVSQTGSRLHTVTGSDGRDYRVLTRGTQLGALQVGRDLSETNRVLSDLRARILLVGGIAVALAGVAGWLFARGLTRSLRQLTEAAAEVSVSGRLDIDVSQGGRDEVGRLGKAFASMLGVLSRSREEQQRLVQDAGHELRTPLTSLRTNVDVLRRHHDLPGEMRSRVLDDLDTEVAELSALVEEVVAVGSGRSSDEPARPFVLSDAVDAAAERVSRRTGRPISVSADRDVVVAQRALLERAITNLLDNAAKFDGTDQPLQISAAHGRVAVRDHGPGILAADLPHVFDRFFRSVAARSLPGSGLGLSIVTEVAAAHGGSTFAENAPDGGAIVGFQLPVASGTHSSIGSPPEAYVVGA
ncbi:MAG TPA: HAMP domain-containing sensor histidine kinase [Ilumatobacteraceae bacterium]